MERLYCICRLLEKLLHSCKDENRFQTDEASQNMMEINAFLSYVVRNDHFQEIEMWLTKFYCSPDFVIRTFLCGIRYISFVDIILSFHIFHEVSFQCVLIIASTVLQSHFHETAPVDKSDFDLIVCVCVCGCAFCKFFSKRKYMFIQLQVCTESLLFLFCFGGLEAGLWLFSSQFRISV